MPGIRDVVLLQSAVYSAVQVFEAVEFYPTIEEKAARLAFALSKNHAFADGNKRVSIHVMLSTLILNGITLHFTQAELIALGFTRWLKEKCVTEEISQQTRRHKDSTVARFTLWASF